VCDFNETYSREDTFKLGTWNESLHEISNINEVSAVNLATSKSTFVNNTNISKVQHLYRLELFLMPTQSD